VPSWGDFKALGLKWSYGADHGVVNEHSVDAYSILDPSPTFDCQRHRLMGLRLPHESDDTALISLPPYSRRVGGAIGRAYCVPG
jgi:hypothetical protein